MTSQRPQATTFLTALLLLVGCAVTLFWPRAASAEYREAHALSDDVRLTIGANGVATVAHHLRYRVVAGRYKFFDVAGIDPQAKLVPESTALVDTGGDLPVHVERQPKTEDGVRLSFDDPKGIGRGVYVVDLTYELDLVGTKKVTRDGAMWRIGFSAPPSGEGLDGARVVFELPSSPTEPRLADPEEASTTMATLRRTADKDTLELVRAHVPRGESVTWSIRVDPKAFPAVSAPELRPTTLATDEETASRKAPIALSACALCVVAGVLAFVFRAKRARVVAMGEAASVEVRPLVAVPGGSAPFVYGALVSAALPLLLWGNPTFGGLLLVLAMALAAHRPPHVLPQPRGPGRWRAIVEADLMAASSRRSTSSPADPFDVRTSRGRWVVLALLVGLSTLTFALSKLWPGALVAVPLASCALVPLFATGTRWSLPLRPAALYARFLEPVRAELTRGSEKRANTKKSPKIARDSRTPSPLRCVARFREGASEFDEVRLVCTPERGIPGLRSVELALAPAADARFATFELLVRYDEASEAAAKIARIAPRRPIVVGRVPEERVLRLAPFEPTSSAAAKLVARVVSELEGQRATDAIVAEETPRTRRSRSPSSRASRASREKASWFGPERRAKAFVPFAPVSSASPASSAP